MKKIKEWFNNLSGATKFIIILFGLFTIFNITVIIWSIIKSKEAIGFVEDFFDEDKRILFIFIGAEDLFIYLRDFEISILTILINMIGYCVSYQIGKMLGYYKSIAEFFINIKNDSLGYFFIMLYDVASMFFDVYTIVSLVI